MLQSIKNNYHKLMAYHLFRSLIMAYAIERLFWEQRGMTIQLMVLAEILYAVVTAALEIPTGALADRFSRKGMMILGAVFTCMEFAVLIYATEVWHFALVVVVAAIAGAATSGTENALLYDSLKVTGEETSFEKRLGRLRAVEYAAHAVAGVSGGVVAHHFSLLTTYWVSLASTIVALLVTFSLTEPPIARANSDEADDTSLAGKAFAFLRAHRPIQFVLAYGVLTGACLVYVDEFWQLYAHDVGVPIIFFGVVLAINCLLTSVSGLVAYKLKGRVSYDALFAVILLLFVIGVAMMALLNNLWGMLFLFLAYGSAGVIEPLVSGYLHHRVPSEFRATAESYQSLAGRVITAAVGLVFGFVSTRHGISLGFALLAAMLAGLLLIYYPVARRYHPPCSTKSKEGAGSLM